LAQQPYDPNEPLQSALQSFPILVKPGGELGFGPEHEDYVQARRSLIAQDQAGRILLMVAPQGNLTLHQLSAFLTDADLGIDIAINLDGGPSSGILLAGTDEVIPALSPLPIVITVHQR
jgi:exopolysaccharide biosynthesis protein